MQSGESGLKAVRIQIIGASTLLGESLAAVLANEYSVQLIDASRLGRANPKDALAICEIQSIEALRELEPHLRARPKIALVREAHVDLLKAILKAGFAGILTCRAGLHDLEECVRTTRSGSSYFDADVQRCLSQVLIAPERSRLTAREKQVAIMVAEGYTSRAIAQELAVSMKTVGNHRRNIFRKLGLHDAVTLTRHVVSSGWVSLNQSPRAKRTTSRPSLGSTAPVESGTRSARSSYPHTESAHPNLRVSPS